MWKIDLNVVFFFPACLASFIVYLYQLFLSKDHFKVFIKFKGRYSQKSLKYILIFSVFLWDVGTIDWLALWNFCFWHISYKNVFVSVLLFYNCWLFPRYWPLNLTIEFLVCRRNSNIGNNVLVCLIILSCNSALSPPLSFYLRSTGRTAVAPTAQVLCGR